MEPVVLIVEPNPTKIATKWALINLLSQIVITYGIQLLNMDMNSPIKYISYIPLVAFLLLAQKEFRDTQLGGYITFGQGFSAGFRYAIFSGLLLAVFMYLYLAILSPEVLTKSMAAQQTILEQKGMSSGDIDKAMSTATKFGPIIGAFGIAIFYAIIGAVVSLVGAAIFKKERSADDIINSLENNETATPDSDPTI
jgi:hypothetical protein